MAIISVCTTCEQGWPCMVHPEDEGVILDPPPRLMPIPEELRFAVAQMVALTEDGWEVCGFQGGGSGKVQFQKVEFRRRRDA